MTHIRIAMLVIAGCIAAVVLAACGSSDSGGSLADELTLDGQTPTFVFFYTDG